MQVGSLVMLDKSRDRNMSESETRDFALLETRGYVFPADDVVYTVRGFTPRGKGIYLQEIVNPKVFVTGFVELAFHIDNFREIQPPMSLEFLEEMQHPVTLLISK